MSDEPTSPSKRAEMADAQGETAGNPDDEVRARTRAQHSRRRRPSPRPGDAARRAPRPHERASRARSNLHTPHGRDPSRAPARSGRVAPPLRARCPRRERRPSAETPESHARIRLAPLLFSSHLFSSSARLSRARPDADPPRDPFTRRRSPAAAWTTTLPRALPPATTTSPARAGVRRRGRTRPTERNARRRTHRRPPPPRTVARARGMNEVRVAGRPLAVARRKNPGWCGPRSCTCVS